MNAHGLFAISRPFPVLLIVALAAGPACSSGQARSAHRAAPSASPVRAEQYTVRDLTQGQISAMHDDPIPANADTETLVPWSDVAILEVVPVGDPEAGALVVRYGANRQNIRQGPCTVYVLEAPGSKIEPISIQWQPESGSELRAIARVDGQLRRYDFDR